MRAAELSEIRVRADASSKSEPPPAVGKKVEYSRLFWHAQRVHLPRQL